MWRTLVLSLLFLVLFLPAISHAQVISGPAVRLNSGDIHVTFSLALDDKHILEIREGIDKELKFYVDLFRVWKVWPDEFVLGRLFTKTIKVSPIKMEYVATSLDGSTLTEKRFRSFDSMIDWVVKFKDVKLTSTRELEPGQYFVRITVESKIRKLPPVVVIFLPENEFKIKKDSPVFTIEGSR